MSGATTISGGTWNLKNSTYIDFDGSNQKSENTDLSDMPSTKGTISVWFNPDDLSSEMTLVDMFDASDASNRRALLAYDGSGEIILIVGGTAVASYEYSASEVAVGKWTQYTATYNTDDNEHKIYLDGVLKATSITVAGDDPEDVDTLRLGSDKGNAYDYNGQMKDVLVYGVVLTQAQVELLYSGKYIGAPSLHWKMDTGSGTTLYDSSPNSQNSTYSNATWVNPDYFIAASTSTAGRTTIDTNCTLSAPRGNLVFGLSGQVSQQFYNHGTFIHNSGTVSATGAVEVHVVGGSNTAFYDITSYGPALAGVGGLRPYVDMTLENSALNGPNTEFQFSGVGDQNKTLTLGTQTSSALIGCTYWDGNNGVADFTVSGVSAAHPAIISSSCAYSRLLGVSGSENYMCANVNVVNVDASQRDIFYGKTEVEKKITLLGDFSAKNIYLENSGTMDLSGNRLECTTYRQWDGPGATSGQTKGSMIVYTGTPVAQYGGAYPVPHTIGYGGAATSLTGTSLLFNTTLGADTRINWNSSINPKYCFTNVLGTPTYEFSAAMNDQQGAHERFIIGNGVYTAYGSSPAWTYNLACKDFFVATGGQYDPAGRIAGDGDDIVVSGAFNLAGGFIGKGALDFSNGPSSGADSADEYLLGASGQTFTEAGITMEAWFKGTNTDALQYIFDGYYSGGYKYNYMAVNGSGKLQAVAAGMGTTEVLYSNTIITDGAWHHLAYTYYDTGGGGNDNIGRLYVDGKMEAEQFMGQSGGAPYTFTTFAIGAANDNAGGYSYGLSGALARVSVWKTALTAADIREMMFYDWAAIDASSIDETTCFTWYEFSDSQAATTVSDMSGSGNTGTLTATGAWVRMVEGEAGPINGPSAGGEGALWFDNDGGTCTYTSAVPHPNYNHNLRFKSMNIATGTTLDKEDIGSYASSVYFSMTDKNFNLYEDAAYENGGGHIGFIKWRVETPVSGMFYVEPGVTFGSWGFACDGNPNYFELPHSSSTHAGPLVFDNYINISDSTVCNINRDIYISANDGLYIGRSSKTTLKEGLEATVKTVRPQGSPDVGGLTFVMEAGSTLTLSGGTSGFCDNDNTERAIKNVLVSGEAALQMRAAEQPEGGVLQVGNGTPYPAGTSPVLTTGNSISMWVKPKNFDNNYSFFGYGSNSNYMQMKPGNQRQAMYGESKAGDPDGDINLDAGENIFTADTWTHVGWVWNADKTWTLYINGVLKDTSVATSDDEFNISFFGRGYSESTDWDGSMADIRLFRSALIAANMVDLAEINSATNVSGTYADPDNDLDAAGWWKLGADAVGAADLTNYGTFGSDYNGQTDGAKKSGFAKIHRKDAGDYLIFPDQVKTGTNKDLDYQFTNLYVTGARSLVIAEDQSLKTKGKVVFAE